MSLFDPETDAKPQEIDIIGAKRAEIAANSPDLDQKQGDLGSIGVDDELAFLYASSKRLLDAVLDDEEIPANQKAQVINATLSALQQISKTRTDLYNAERMRHMESVLIRTLRDFPRELQEQFIEAYERNLQEAQ